MIISEAREFLKQFARSGLDATMYKDENLDRALQVLGNDFIWRTLWPRVTGDIAITADTAAIGSFTATAGTLTGFRPQRLLRAYFVSGMVAGDDRDPWLGTPDFTDLFAQAQRNAATDVPTDIAFETETAALLYPTPDVNYTLRLLWVKPLITWTPGTAPDSPGDVLNLPDDLLQQAILYGATSFLQHNEPQNQYASESRAKYLEFVEQVNSRMSGIAGGRASARRQPGARDAAGGGWPADRRDPSLGGGFF